jgi:hypothetical protein
VVDEIGYLPFGRDEANLIFNVGAPAPAAVAQWSWRWCCGGTEDDPADGGGVEHVVDDDARKGEMRIGGGAQVSG